MLSTGPVCPCGAALAEVRRCRRGHGCRRVGFTLLELLVAIAIIAILLAVTLPAVQQARSAARATECRNHLRQLGMAMLQHESQFTRFPSNGWGYRWIGDPDRGTDERQPGGWIYNLLAQLEQEALRNMGAGMADFEKRAALAQVMETPVAVFKCPSRPSLPLGLHNVMVPPFNADWVPWVAKTDYAVNEGDFITDTPAGPATLAEGDSVTYDWSDTT